MDNELQFDYYLHRKKLSEATRKSIIKQVNAFLLWTEDETIADVTDVSYNDIMAFVKHCNEQGNSQKTIAIKLAFLNHYFMWLVKEEEMKENHVSNIRIKGVQRKKLHNILSRERLDELYQTFTASDVSGMRNKAMLGMIVYQALRVDELTSLTMKDLLIREGKVKVSGMKKVNGRTLNLESHQIVDLMEYLSYARKIIMEETRKVTDKVFISSGSGDKLLNTLQFILAQLKSKHNDIKDWKQIRASVISNWITLHGLRKTQYFAGHRFISSTEEYQQQDLEELLQEINRFHPF